MINRLFEWFVIQSINHSKRTIGLSILFTLLISFGMKYLIIEDDMMKMLPKNIESKIIWDDIQNEFGSTEIIFIAFGDEYSKILNSRALASLWALSESLMKLEMVDKVSSISTANRMENIDDFIEVYPLQEEQFLEKKTVEDIDEYLNNNLKLKKQLISKRGDYLLTIVQPVKGVPLDKLTNQIVQNSQFLTQDYKIIYGGSAYITGSLPTLIREDTKLLVLYGLIIMNIILFVNLRSFRAILLVFTVIFSSLLVMLGSMGWLYKVTNSDRFLFAILSTSMPIILLTIANSDGVHVVTKFFRELRSVKSKKVAIVNCMNSLLLPLFLTTVTTIAAFLTMVMSPLETLIGYGIGISIGIFWAWIMSSLMLPALLNLMNWDLSSNEILEPSIFEKLISQASFGIVRYPVKIFIFGGLLFIIGISGLYRLGVDVNISSFFKPDSEIRKSIGFMDNEMSGTMDLRVLFQGNVKDPELLNEMDEFQNYISKEENVSLVYSIVDIIKQMHRTVINEPSIYDLLPQDQDKINNLFTLYSLSGDSEDFTSFINYSYNKGLLTAFIRTMTTEEIFSFSRKIQSYADNNIKSSTSVHITGFIIVLRDMVLMIIKSSFSSIFLSLFFVFTIVSIFFKKKIWGLVSILPLVIAISLNFGLMGHFGIKLNHITAILSSIIIGVGIDFSIHFISQFRQLSKSTKKEKLAEKTIQSVGYPILLDAGSNMGFGALVFSSFIPVQYIGGLMIFAMISTSFGTLIILASCMEIFKNYLIN